MHGDGCSTSSPMAQFFDALKETQAKGIESPILDMVREWKGTGESLLKSLVDHVSDIESRERNLSLVSESLEKRLKDLEEREREFESFKDGKIRELALKESLLSPVCEDLKEVELREKKLDEQLKLVHEHIESLEVAQSEVHGLRLMECEKLKEIEMRERELDSIAWSLEKRLREVERREKEFDLFRDGKLREFALKEEVLSRKKEEFVREVRLANEKLTERDKLGRLGIERLETALSMIEGMKVMIDEKFKEIKSWETVAHKSLIASFSEADLIRESLEKRFTECEEMEEEFNMLQEEKMQKLESKERQLRIMRTELLKDIKLRDDKLMERFNEIESWETVVVKTLTASLKEADLIRESLEKRFKEFEEMKKEFNSIQEDKMQKLESKERQLSITRTELLKEIKLRDEKLTGQQKLGHQLLTCIEEMLSKKLKEIESRELSVNVACETLDASAKEADLTRESATIRFQELENKEKEFQLYQERNMRELVLAEEKLRLIGKEFIQEVMFGEEKFDMQEKMMHGLLERLELAQNNVKDMNTLVRERFKEIGSKEIELNHTRDWVERKMDELEFKAKERKEQEKEIKLEEDVPMFEEKELEPKRKDYECNEPHLKVVDRREKSMNSIREFTQTCFKENLELNKKPDHPKNLVENDAGYLSEKYQQPECSPREVELKGKQNSVLKKCEFKQPQLTDALDCRSRVKPNHLKRAVQMDGKTLEMLINDTEKDLELLGAEVFKVLFLSSDPAKLVLDAIEGYYIPRLGKGDIEVNVWRKGILLLDQLTKMSPSIQPCVREAAIKLVSRWKSKMSTAENPFEVLGFLHFLAAYNLSSCFDKDELLSLLKTVAQHKQTPELCRILGLSENISGSFLSYALFSFCISAVSCSRNFFSCVIGFIQNLINEKQYLLASTYIYECGLENMFPHRAVLNYYVQHSKAKRRKEHTSSEAQDKAIASEIADLHLAIEHIIKYGLESEYSPDGLTARIKQLERNRASLRNGTPLSTDVRKQEKSRRFAQPEDSNKRMKQEKQHEPLLQHEQEIKSPPRLNKLVNEAAMPHPSKRRRTNISWHEGTDLGDDFRLGDGLFLRTSTYDPPDVIIFCIAVEELK
ncbi:hypothetical protein DH2020_001304 [Rehmannia glutinosa]|uniref:FRIGIDA-like protein n=1 Tax=Rehmannia glutinosa TaxID=99300 RepID=A0ABR0XYZ8_REHGL